MSAELPFTGLKTIIEGLKEHLRWQGKTESGQSHYPFTEKGISESVWDHTRTSRSNGAELLKKYSLVNINPKICRAMLGIHDFSEYYDGDISVHVQNDGIRKPDEKASIKKLVDEFKLSIEIVTLFDAFENWQDTEDLPLEAAFCRFIDGYVGALMYLSYTYQVKYTPEEYQQSHFVSDIDSVKKRVFEPLRKLAQLYREGNCPADEKKRLLRMVIAVQKQIRLCFGDYAERSRDFFLQDVCEIYNQLQSF